jgi:hypothetical protein
MSPTLIAHLRSVAEQTRRNVMADNELARLCGNRAGYTVADYFGAYEQTRMWYWCRPNLKGTS